MFVGRLAALRHGRVGRSVRPPARFRERIPASRRTAAPGCSVDPSQAAAADTAATTVRAPFGRSRRLSMARAKLVLPCGRSTEIARFANAARTRGRAPLRTRQTSSPSAVSRPSCTPFSTAPQSCRTHCSKSAGVTNSGGRLITMHRVSGSPLPACLLGLHLTRDARREPRTGEFQPRHFRVRFRGPLDRYPVPSTAVRSRRYWKRLVRSSAKSGGADASCLNTMIGLSWKWKLEASSAESMGWILSGRRSAAPVQPSDAPPIPAGWDGAPAAPGPRSFPHGTAHRLEPRA